MAASPPATPDPTGTALEAVRALVRAHYPTAKPVRLVVDFDGQPSAIVLLIPPPHLTMELSAAGLAVVEWFKAEPAAAHADGQELAGHTGYAYAAHLKRELALLTKAGVLASGPDGYVRGPQFPG